MGTFRDVLTLDTEEFRRLEQRLPDCFLLDIVRDKRAMQRFSSLSAKERDRVVARARAARSRAEMRLLVLSLSDRVEAQEFY